MHDFFLFQPIDLKKNLFLITTLFSALFIILFMQLIKKKTGTSVSLWIGRNLHGE